MRVKSLTLEMKMVRRMNMSEFLMNACKILEHIILFTKYFTSNMICMTKNSYILQKKWRETDQNSQS
jgi:hypothetical protein